MFKNLDQPCRNGRTGLVLVLSSVLSGLRFVFVSAGVAFGGDNSFVTIVSMFLLLFMASAVCIFMLYVVP